MHKKLLALMLMIAITMMSCNLVTQATAPSDIGRGENIHISASLPVLDPAAPQPSPGSSALNGLVLLDPSVGALTASVEAVESEGLALLFAQLLEENPSGSRFELPGMASRPGPALKVDAALQPVDRLQPAAQTGAGQPETIGSLIAITSALSDMITPRITQGNSVNSSVTQTKDGATSTLNMDLGLNPDGTSKFGLGIQTEATVDGKTAKTVFAASVEGLRCPDAGGKVTFTAKVRLGADAGNVALDQDLTANVTAEVNDAAEIVSTTIEAVQGTRQVKDGRQVYVETTETISFQAWDTQAAKSTNLHMVRASQEATLQDKQTLSSDGLTAAEAMGASALKVAEQNWQNNGCITIEAPSPGKVAPSSETSIPVKVIHKLEGSEVAVQVQAALAGGQSISPDVLPKTPATLTYTAPAENNQSATITLTATSKRGKARLELNANTGGRAYQITGSLDEAKMSGSTCDSSQPFHIGGTLDFTFTPSSPTAGSYTYTGPFGAYGSGPYVIYENGTMTLEGTGCIMGGCRTYAHTWIATPLDSAACP